jgi:predicted nucleotidyltransferase
MDLSDVTALKPLAEVVRDALRAAEQAQVEIFLAGAIARDLWLEFGHGFPTRRATGDLDFAVQCEGWEQFGRMAEGLLAAGFQRRDADARHRFRHSNGAPIDIVPFGGIERPDHTIAWPPDHSHVMSLIGFREALDSTVTFVLPGQVTVPVVSLPALAALKLVAWRERRALAPRKDAHDLELILRNYADAGNRDRLFDEIPGLHERASPDLELWGAELLGRDLATISSELLHETLVRILEAESDSASDLRLAAEMIRQDVERARQFLVALLSGLLATRDSG